MKEIYLILQPTGSYDTYYPNIRGWVETEEEAKKICKALDDSIPQCPFKSEKKIQKMEDFLGDWWEVESEYFETHKSPYEEPIDGSNLCRVTDTAAHSQWVDEQNKELYRMRTEWFEKNTAAQSMLPAGTTWESLLNSWDAWKDETYEETGKAYYTKINKL